MTKVDVDQVNLSVDDVNVQDPDALESFLDLIEQYYCEAWPRDAASENWRERYRAMILDQDKSQQKHWNWLIMHQNEVVGLATFHLDGAASDLSAEIKELYVKPSFRNKHLGKRIMEMVRSEASQYGAKRIRASVQYDELGNIKFFESIGFHLDRLSIVMDL